MKDAPPADELSEAIAAQIGTSGWTVIRGTKSTVCDVWPCKEWTVKADFKPTPELLYPFEPGQLLGVIRYRRKGGDIRDQELARGIYTIRYALQPVDGNHEGTSPTRDFLLLVRADADQSAEPMEEEELNELSAEAADSSHPAMLALQKAKGQTGDVPSMRHDQEKDWWIVHFTGKAAAGNQTRKLGVEVVVVGVTEE